jgi:hypothetical protein
MLIPLEAITFWRLYALADGFALESWLSFAWLLDGGYMVEMVAFLRLWKMEAICYQVSRLLSDAGSRPRSQKCHPPVKYKNKIAPQLFSDGPAGMPLT